MQQVAKMMDGPAKGKIVTVQGELPSYFLVPISMPLTWPSPDVSFRAHRYVLRRVYESRRVDFISPEIQPYLSTTLAYFYEGTQ